MSYYMFDALGRIPYVQQAQMPTAQGQQYVDYNKMKCMHFNTLLTKECVPSAMCRYYYSQVRQHGCQPVNLFEKPL